VISPSRPIRIKGKILNKPTIKSSDEIAKIVIYHHFENSQLPEVLFILFSDYYIFKNYTII
jgi:hypothetical protein